MIPEGSPASSGSPARASGPDPPLISSTKNPRVAAAAKLKKRGLREQARRFLVEGARATAEGLDAGAIESLFAVPGSTGRVVAARQRGIPLTEVSEAVMAHLTSAVTPQGLVGVARFVDVPIDDVPASGLVAILCSVRDPGNAGAILRSADAAGSAGVVFSEGSVDVYNPKAVRASAGSLFHLPVAREVPVSDAVGHLRAAGARVLAAVADGEASAYETDLTRPTALLLGNEAWGLTPEVRRLADAGVRVPIAGRAESLNLAAAAALLMFEAARQRAAGAGLADTIAAWAHDLRLPLTALRGFGQTIVDRWDRFDDAERLEMLRGMLVDIERLSAMVTLIVEAARRRAPGGPPPPGREEVSPTLHAVRAMFERSPDYPGVEVRGEGHAAIDPTRLSAVLIAVCEGALWFGHEGPIRIEAMPTPDGLVVEVDRAGEPIPEPIREAMFASPGTEGSRAGLHLARGIVESLGGRLTAEEHDGIRFRIFLPSA